jgi:Leucine-rich repeat (LRR) protein
MSSRYCASTMLFAVRQMIKSLPALSEFHGRIQQDADEGVEHLCHAKRLRVVGLYCSTFANSAFDAFGTLPELEELDVSQSKLSGNLSPLVNCRKLKKFLASSTQFDDDAIKDLCRISTLEYISLAETEITDVSCADFAKLTGLRKLLISDTKITSQGLFSLAPLKRLECLFIDGIAMDDSRLQQLAQLPCLTTLRLSGTNFSAEQRRQFESLKPECDIYWGD